MALFLSTFLAAYGLLNAFLLVRARAALSLGPSSTTAAAVFMVGMMTMPIMIRVTENAGLTIVARFFSLVGYTWLGLLFMWVCATVLTDIYRAGLFLGSHLTGKDLSLLSLSARSYFLLACTAVAGASIYGGFEARHIRTERIVIKSTKFSPAASPLIVAQISDVHLGLTVREDRLKLILRQVIDAKPDILVSTGDLVDGQMNDMSGVEKMLSDIRPKYGKFAVTGNHEFYAGLDQAIAFTRKAGFEMLRDQTVTIPGIVNIAGVDDPAGLGIGSRSTGEEKLLSVASNGLFTLLLKHRPGIGHHSPGLFDLQLSGHVHYGQIFPFRLITRLVHPRIGGLHTLPRGSAVYVSRGSGTWGPPIRFLSPPEVTVIELVGESSQR
jgi:uncharacterized protein